MAEPSGERLIPREDGEARLLGLQHAIDALRHAGILTDDFLTAADVLSNGLPSQYTWTALSALRKVDFGKGVPQELAEKIQAAKDEAEAFYRSSLEADVEEANRKLAIFPSTFWVGVRHTAPVASLFIDPSSKSRFALRAKLADDTEERVGAGSVTIVKVDMTRFPSEVQEVIDDYIQVNELGL